MITIRRIILPLALAAPLHAQQLTLDDVIRAEDGRRDVATLRSALHAADPMLRRAAVRALGRFERADLIPDIASALDDRAPAVRAAAADALILAASHAGADDARRAAFAHLAAERSASVRGALGEALGWIPQGSAAQARATGDSLAARTYDAADSVRAATLGVVRGLFGLARQPIARGALSPTAIGRLEALVRYHAESRARDHVEVREIAGMALAAQQALTEDVAATLLGDVDPWVRSIGVRAIGPLADTLAAERLAHRALGDASAMVRTLATNAYARKFGPRRRCATFVRLAADRDVNVRLAAIDALGSPCAPGDDAARAVARLDSVAAIPLGASWHAGAHALVSLAAVSPERARDRLPAYATSADFFVREYAARAAARLADTATLRRLASDAHPNVRVTAVGALSTVLGHAADDVYRDALASADNQLLMTAAKALEKSPSRGVATALFDALDRASADRRETMRDARVALLDRVRELGDSSLVARVRPYVADYDTSVAIRAADVVGAWTGTRPTPAPVAPVALALPTARELARLAASHVELTLGTGDRITIQLFPFDAPTNAARFARLVREKKLDGLTVHRVVPARLVQGGSPGANEYAGWGAFTRDELGIPNRRGAVGTSTRGRDTGDGQFYVDTGDLFELDHNYTVFGQIVRGLDAIERMQEGTRIVRARIVP